MIKSVIKHIRAVCVTLTLIGAPLASLVMPGVVHAAGGGTFTWSGGGGDGNWSTGANWVGGTAPQTGDVGDTVIIDNAATFTFGSTDDLASLSLASLKFVSNGATVNNIALANPLTITGDINQDASDTTTKDTIENSGSAQTITIGGDVTVTSTAGLIFGGSTADNIAIDNGNTLTFTDTGAPNIVALIDNITNTSGTATVTYNGSQSQYQISGNNTYAGTTNVQSTFSLAGGVVVLTANPFGTSTVNVSNTGNIEFQSNISSLNNTVVVAGSSSTQPPVSLNWGDLLTGSFTIPNIVLNGNAQFSNDAAGNLTIDLSGITSNGFCILYTNTNDPTSLGASANSFTGGPTDCSSGGTVAPTAAAPKTPDTGFALAAAHPAETVAFTLVAASSILLVARRLKTAKH